jgi:hypothetical protein
MGNQMLINMTRMETETFLKLFLGTLKVGVAETQCVGYKFSPYSDNVLISLCNGN